ncbi:MAG TPA: Fic family protein [Rhizomicrobium sp.]|nr:Fic family protein [Rhizomicrobium sp.]
MGREAPHPGHRQGRHHFQAVRFIETGMADVYRRLSGSGFLAGLSPDDFAEQAGVILGDVNYVHPFREGNGRTQLQYLKQLAGRAGHPIDLRKIDGQRWHEASRLAHGASYGVMAECIAGAISAPGKPGGESKKGKGKRKR